MGKMKRIIIAMSCLMALILMAGSVHAQWKVEPGDPSRSFWKDQVHYPYAVSYAKAGDSQGVTWEIAYMDEYAGSEPNPDVLVLIHGKGVFGGYFGHLMKMALENGLRVIAPDLPHYGKSIPGNLNNPLARSLEDTREAVHDLIVNQLGVKKASYLGHSLGGQWVIGYALKYPDAVEKLILESPGGMEEFPTNIKVGQADVGFFDPSCLRDMGRWESIWTVALQTEFKKDAEAIRNFYYFKKKNPDTGQIKPSELGYFKKPDPYADFVTEVRVNMINGNKKEYDNYVYTYIRDIYSMGVEVRKEDPDSLVKRMKSLRIPVFLAYGEEEPFIPTTIFSGNKSLYKDIIAPFEDALTANGHPPVVKLYPGVGHFSHTDIPDVFANDVIRFVKGTMSRSAEPAGGDDLRQLKREIAELKGEVKGLKSDSDKFSKFMDKFSFGVDYRATGFYIEQYPDQDAAGNSIDDKRGVDQLIRLKMDFKDEDGVEFKGRLILNDQHWQGDRRVANAAGSNVSDHEDNIALDYGYLKVPFGSGFSAQVGRQAANWGNHFTTCDDRRDRIALFKQIGYTHLIALYDKRQEGLVNVNDDDGNLAALTRPS